MITEQFINTCCRLIVSDNKSIPPNIISDISDIVNTIKDADVPLLFRKKFQLLTTLISLKTNDPNVDTNTLVDSVLTTGYFKDIESYINGIIEMPLTDEQVKKCLDSIATRKSMLSISKNGELIQKFLDKVKVNGFKDVNTATSEWQNLIGNVHADIINKDRAKNLHNITSLDLLNDDYEPVINQIKVSYSGVNSISTGYDSLDCHMYGGFAPSRLYMFCAPSGGGKSVMLINLVKNAVDRNLVRNDERRAIYIYVSLENLIDESLLRLYSCLSSKTTESIINNYETEKHLIPKTVKNWLNDNNAIIKFLYKKPQYTTCFDIMTECNDIKTQYPNCDIKAIYIDYLDLMKPNITSKSSDAYRLELGQITIDMKTLAVLLRVPIVTCTQVNRAGYDPKNRMNLTNIGESMKKVDNSDWICMMQPKEDDDEKSGSKTYNSDMNDMDLKITKSRFGHKDVSIPFRTNFSKFKFEEIRKNNGIDIDMNLNELDQRTIVSDKVTQIQNGRYNEDTESDLENMDGFI